MKIGLIGVGPHGRKLAAAFQAEGAEIAGHTLHSKRDPVPGFGLVMTMPEMLRKCDAVVLATSSPEANLANALDCAAAGVPVLVTKPLMLEAPIELRAPFYVDYWRLWDPQYLALKHAVRACGIRKITSNFYGNGPIRGFPGLLDYGPHVLAYLHDLIEGDLVFEPPIIEKREDDAERVKVTGWIGQDDAGADFFFRTGNGFTDRRYDLVVTTKYGLDFSFESEATGVAAVSPMVRAFMDDVRTGRIDDKWMKMTVAITQDLKKIRQAVDLSR
jgi:predicted dehydrogenase